MENNNVSGASMIQAVIKLIGAIVGIIALISVLSSCEKLEYEEEAVVGEWQLNGIHRDKGYHWSNPDGDAVYCNGKTQEGRSCMNKTTNHSGYCYLHGGQDNGTYNYPVTELNINSRQGVINFIKSTDKEMLDVLKYEFLYRDFCDFKIYKQSDNVYASTKCLVTNDNTWTHTQLPVELCQYGEGQDNGYLEFGEIGKGYYNFYLLAPGEQTLSNRRIKYKKDIMGDIRSSVGGDIRKYERLALVSVGYNFVLYFDKK
jgi:hypothetical protein